MFFWVFFFTSYVFLGSMCENRRLAVEHAVIWIVIIEPLHELLSRGTKHALRHLQTGEKEGSFSLSNTDKSLAVDLRHRDLLLF